MAITLIVTKSIDVNFEKTGGQIAIGEWLELVNTDPTLTIRKEPYVTRLPDGQELGITVLPTQSELNVDGRIVPFLGYRQGNLVMKYTEEMENSDNPVRKKVGEIARQLGALLTHDAGDEILDW